MSGGVVTMLMFAIYCAFVLVGDLIGGTVGILVMQLAFLAATGLEIARLARSEP